MKNGQLSICETSLRISYMLKQYLSSCWNRVVFVLYKCAEIVIHSLNFPRRLIRHLKSQVVSLQTAHSWANAGVLLGDACIGSGVAFEAI